MEESLALRIDRLERKVNRQRYLMVLVFIAGVLVGYSAHGGEALQAAIRDRAEFPTSEHPFLFYLDHSMVDDPEELAKVTAFMCASTSRQIFIEHCLPVQVNADPDVYRIDLRDLQWDLTQWHVVLSRYPYFYDLVQDDIVKQQVVKLKGRKTRKVVSKQVVGGKFYLIAEDGSALSTTAEYYNEKVVLGKSYTSDRWVQFQERIVVQSVAPIMIRADWLVVELADAASSDSYYRLLYGKPDFPSTRDEFFAFWNVQQTPQFTWGLIEGKSGVSKNKAHRREIYEFEGDRVVYAWKTEDVFEVTLKNDPLNLTYPGSRRRVDHDGEESIVGVRKVSKVHRTRASLQVYLLSDGKGKRIDKADGDLVEDYTKFRDFAQIRTPGSCIQCHISGLNPPTVNALEASINRGVDVLAKTEGDRDEIDRIYLTEVGQSIKRDNEDYEQGVKAVNGLTPEENAAAFKRVVDVYDKSLTLVAAARELECTVGELQFAIATYNNGVAPPAIANLVHGKAVARSVWEEYFGTAKLALQQWKGQ